jgi:hypothetical protein
VLEDISGCSYIQNFSSPSVDPNLTITPYTLTKSHNAILRLNIGDELGFFYFFFILFFLFFFCFGYLLLTENAEKELEKEGNTLKGYRAAGSKGFLSLTLFSFYFFTHFSLCSHHHHSSSSSSSSFSSSSSSSTITSSTTPPSLSTSRNHHSRSLLHHLLCLRSDEGTLRRRQDGSKSEVCVM